MYFIFQNVSVCILGCSYTMRMVYQYICVVVSLCVWMCARPYVCACVSVLLLHASLFCKEGKGPVTFIMAVYSKLLGKC